MEVQMETIQKEDLKRLGIKEVAKRVRTDLKRFTDLKFSVRIEHYSMGCSLHVHLMESKKDGPKNVYHRRERR